MKETKLSAFISRDDKLKISTSGIRGIVNTGLDFSNSFFFFLSFSKIIKEKVIIARDTRPSSEALSNLLISVLLSRGKTVLNLGIAPTPTLKFAVETEKADAGVMITASHNPIEWNGFKFFRKGGFYFRSTDWENWHDALKQSVNSNDYALQIQEKGDYEQLDKSKKHVEAVLSLIPDFGIKLIQNQFFKILVDSAGGTGSLTMQYLLERLNCKSVFINDTMKKNDFPRKPEPTMTNLIDFTRQLQQNKFSIGFALDPDSDRLIVGSPKQGTINEEFTIVLALCGLLKLYELNPSLKKGRRVVVLNRSTSTLIKQITSSMNIKVVYSSVGEENVVRKMQKNKAMLGGEGNGGVISLDVPSCGRDPLVGVLLILYYMAYAKVRSIDPLLSLLPPLYMHKIKMDKPKDIKIEKIYKKLLRHFSKGKSNMSDGLYLSFSTQAWLHIRPSNTEPQIRLIAQATSDEEVINLLKQAKSIIASLQT